MENKTKQFAFSQPIAANTIMRATYRDSDQMGFVYYANYLVWFEIGRTELLRRCGKTYNQMENDGIILPVRYCDCEYIRPFKYDDLIRIETVIEELTKVSMTFRYRLFTYPKDELCAAGSTKHIFISPDLKVIRAGDKVYEIINSCSDEVIKNLLKPLANAIMPDDKIN